MEWSVQLDEEFEAWLLGLPEHVQDRILAHVELLRAYGPSLGRPHVDTLKGSRVPSLKELRVQVGGDPWRVLFAFDPERKAILLIGGNKGEDERWYEVNIPIAEERFERHLERLRQRKATEAKDPKGGRSGPKRSGPEGQGPKRKKRT